MLFKDLNRGEQDQAARAGLARFLVHRLGAVSQVPGHGRQLLALGVAEAVHEGLSKADPTYNATSVGRWVGYCNGVWSHEQKASNREWAEYPPQVRAVATQIADYVEGHAFA